MAYINIFTEEVDDKLYEIEHNPSGKWSWMKDKYVTFEEKEFVKNTVAQQLRNLIIVTRRVYSKYTTQDVRNIRWKLTKDMFKFLSTNVSKRFIESYPEFKVTVYKKLLQFYYHDLELIANTNTATKESTVKRQISGYCIDIFGIPIGHRNGDMSVDELRELPMNFKKAGGDIA
jgi:hypothetical protein